MTTMWKLWTKFSRIGILLLGGVLMATAQQPTPEAAPELAIDQIKKSVVFIRGGFTAIRTQEVNGIRQQVQTQEFVSGTGFLIFIPDSRLGSDRGMAYVVTNKHLIREPSATGELGEGPYLKEITIRMNTKQRNPDGTQFKVFSAGVVDGSGNLSWLIHDNDDTVDLALTPIGLDQSELEFKFIPATMFATKESLKEKQVNENDELLFTGLFAWHPGAKKNYPIVRHGKLARLSEERIPLDRRHPDKTVEIHLADVMSFGGNSGSPVFLRLGGMRELHGGSSLQGYSYSLLGVMQGFFPENLEFALEVATLRGAAAQNSGIAAVIPADKINEILQSPRALAFNARVVAEHYVRAGNLSGAEELYKTSISLLEKNSPEHGDLATTLTAYAELLRKSNRVTEANAAVERARRILANINTDRFHPRK